MSFKRVIALMLFALMLFTAFSAMIACNGGDDPGEQGGQSGGEGNAGGEGSESGGTENGGEGVTENSAMTYEQYLENLDNLVYLWEKAEELACNDEQKLNVRRSATQIKYIEVCVAYETYRRSGNEADLEAFKVINQAYGDYLATLDYHSYKLPSNWTIDGDPNVWKNDAK